MGTDELTAAVMARYRELQRNPHLNVPAIQALETDISAIIFQIRYEPTPAPERATKDTPND